MSPAICGATIIAAVLRSISAGEVYVAPSLAFGLLREMSKPRPSDPLAELSSRERQVLELVANGMSNQEIGLQLGLAEKTIKHYMTNIMQKLHVRNRVEQEPRPTEGLADLCGTLEPDGSHFRAGPIRHRLGHPLA